MPWQKQGDGTWLDLETMQVVEYQHIETRYPAVMPDGGHGAEPDPFRESGSRHRYGATAEMLERCRWLSQHGHTPAVRSCAAAVLEFGSLSLAADNLQMSYGGLKKTLHRAWFADRHFAKPRD